MDNKIKELEDKIKELKNQIKDKDRALREKNLALDAMHFIWCTGCEAGAHRWSENTITEETVKKAKEITERLETWWTNHYNRELDKGNIQLSDSDLLSYIYFRIVNPVKYVAMTKMNLIQNKSKKDTLHKFLAGLILDIEQFFKSMR